MVFNAFVLLKCSIKKSIIIFLYFFQVFFVVFFPYFLSQKVLKNESLLVITFTIINVMYTGNIEALFVLVHAVLDCQKHIRCFVEPFQLLPHPGLDWQVHTHYGIPHINASLLPPISR